MKISNQKNERKEPTVYVGVDFDALPFDLSPAERGRVGNAANEARDASLRRSRLPGQSMTRAVIETAEADGRLAAEAEVDIILCEHFARCVAA